MDVEESRKLTMPHRYLDNSAVKVYEGGVDVITPLLKEPFDHYFYTGIPLPSSFPFSFPYNPPRPFASPLPNCSSLPLAKGNSTHGKKVAAAAAEHLASTTLELGGKNPCIVDKDANLPVAAKRIAWYEVKKREREKK